VGVGEFRSKLQRTISPKEIRKEIPDYRPPGNYAVFLIARRARMRVRTDEMAYAPPANPAKIRVGFSGDRSHPPWAHAGIATSNANARAVRRKVFFIGRSYFRRDPGALGCNE
jgi:hypothetical protein